MGYKTKLAVVIFIPFIFSIHLAAQADTAKNASVTHPLKIAILAPLYIDSAFNNNTYKLSKNSMPKYILSGLEFYNGVMMAVDTLKKNGANIEVFIYDTKKKGRNIDALVSELGTINFSLIIASITGIGEQKPISVYAFQKNIPVISATFPNDAYLVANPFFIMLNSSLKTHVEGIYKYVSRNFAVARLIYITKKGPTETKIQDEFTKMDKKTAPLKYTVAELSYNFSESDLIPLMDSSKQNVFICGTLDENFGLNLVRALSNYGTDYETTVIGLPNWDGLRDLSGNDCNNVQIIYSTPYNFPKTEKTVSSIARNYKTKYLGRASDMVFKGYESMYHFTSLLLKHSTNFLNNLSDPAYKISGGYKFEPVKLNASSFVPDYIENKKLYFVQQLNGVIKSVTSY